MANMKYLYNFPSKNILKNETISKVNEKGTNSISCHPKDNCTIVTKENVNNIIPIETS